MDTNEVYNHEAVSKTNEKDLVEQNMGKYSWVDITKSFKAACMDLRLGELFHNST